MKKLIAIFILVIHLFSIGGQLALHQYLVYQSDKFFNEQADKNYYNVDDLTEVKVPVKLPNAVNWKCYQNLAGRVEFKNAAYNYVKIKVTPSAIYLLCVPNYETTHLCINNIINARQITDLPVPKKDHVPFGKISLAAYSYQSVHYSFYVPVFEIGQLIQSIHLFFKSSNISGPGQPPDYNALTS